MSNILEITDLEKKYPKSSFALSNVNFSVPYGTIMGFVGENGAGKTTTINSILGIIQKDSGTVKVFGQELSDDNVQLCEDIGVVYFGNETLLELFPYVTLSMFAVSGIATLHKDTVSQWIRYELTLPIKRRDLVSSKYANYIFWTLSGLTISVIVVFVTFVIHGNLFAYGIRDCFSHLSLGVGLAIIADAIFFPLAIICGADKSEILLAISVLSSVGLAILTINAVNALDLNYAARMTIFNLTYILMYALSYFISSSLYMKKEF